MPGIYLLLRQLFPPDWEGFCRRRLLRMFPTVRQAMR
jgi:hypothetical protein